MAQRIPHAITLLAAASLFFALPACGGGTSQSSTKSKRATKAKPTPAKAAPAPKNPDARSRPAPAKTAAAPKAPSPPAGKVAPSIAPKKAAAPAAKPAIPVADKTPAKVIKKPAPKVIKKPAAKPKGARKPAPKVTKKPAAKPAPKVIKKPAPKPAPKVAKKPAAKPAPKVTKKATALPPGVKPCVRKAFRTSQVRASCRKGQKSAKRLMQRYVRRWKKTLAIKVTCKSCHTALGPNYPLKSNGLRLYRDYMKKLKAAPKSGQAPRLPSKRVASLR